MPEEKFPYASEESGLKLGGAPYQTMKIDILELSNYHPNARLMKQCWGYELGKKPGLIYGKGTRALPLPFVPKGKKTNYYHVTRQGLG